jgi:hypothetical protein
MATIMKNLRYYIDLIEAEAPDTRVRSGFGLTYGTGTPGVPLTAPALNPSGQPKWQYVTPGTNNDVPGGGPAGNNSANTQGRQQGRLQGQTVVPATTDGAGNDNSAMSNMTGSLAQAYADQKNAKMVKQRGNELGNSRSNVYVGKNPDYGGDPTDDPDGDSVEFTRFNPTTKAGAAKKLLPVDPVVKKAQDYLASQATFKSLLGPTGADGRMGANTKNAIEQFLKRYPNMAKQEIINVLDKYKDIKRPTSGPASSSTPVSGPAAAPVSGPAAPTSSSSTPVSGPTRSAAAPTSGPAAAPTSSSSTPVSGPRRSAAAPVSGPAPAPVNPASSPAPDALGNTLSLTGGPPAPAEIPPRPPQGGGKAGEAARIAWSKQYGATHNPDGSPKANPTESRDDRTLDLIRGVKL